MFNVSNLVKSYSVGEKTQPVVRNLSFAIEQAQLTAFAGTSGSGKSTLLSLLSGLEQADSGEIRFNQQAYSQITMSELAQLRNQYFGFIFQTAFFIPYKTVLENILLPFSYSNQDIDAAEAQEKAVELAEYVGISEQLDKYPSLLSGGEQQRMSFARALILQPQVIFADEPTASLDKDNSTRIMELLKEQVEQGKTVILVSHDEFALSYADTVMELVDKGESIVVR